ncbi:MAG: DUF859 family phage minor structural protein [Christensenellales bacterium]
MARSTPVHGGYTIINGSGTGPNGYRIDVWVEYLVASQSIENNISHIIAYFYACLNPSYASSTYGGNGCYSSFSVDGVWGSNLKSNGNFDFRDSDVLNLMGTYEGDVTHNADGAKNLSFNGSFTTPSSYITGGNVSGSPALPTIPRATTPALSDSDFDMGTAIQVDLSSRASAGFTHTLSYAFGTATDTIITKTSSTSVNFTPPVALAAQIPSAISGYGTLHCDTYSGDTLVGTKSVGFTLQVPSSVVPSISGVTPTNYSANAAISGWNILVKGYSTLTLAAAAAGIYGSTIVSYKFEIKKAGVVKFSTIQAGVSWTSGLFSEAGTDYTYVVTVTDTRGRTATFTSGAFTVYDYSPPSISLANAFRSNVSGT